jgi:hypothetical protein
MFEMEWNGWNGWSGLWCVNIRSLLERGSEQKRELVTLTGIRTSLEKVGARLVLKDRAARVSWPGQENPSVWG